MGLLISHLLAPTGIFQKLVPNDIHSHKHKLEGTEAEGNHPSSSILFILYD